MQSNSDKDSVYHLHTKGLLLVVLTTGSLETRYIVMVLGFMHAPMECIIMFPSYSYMMLVWDGHAYGGSGAASYLSIKVVVNVTVKHNFWHSCHFFIPIHVIMTSEDYSFSPLL